MKKVISLILLGCLLSGCGLLRVHRMNIEQGNIITQEDLSRLHKGMSEAEVKEIMGTPILTHLFTPDRLDYVYTFKQGHQAMRMKKLICVFKNGSLTEIIKY